MLCAPGFACDGKLNFTCSPVNQGGPGPTPDAGFVPTAGVALAVISAKQVSQLGSSTAGSSNVLVPVEVRLGNGESQSLSLAAPLFTFRTTAGLDYPGSQAITLQAAGSCPADALLAPKAEVRCTVAFDVPSAAEAKQLLYRTPDGGSASAPLSVPPCTRCSGVCVDLKTDPNNCGTCGTVVQTCVGGKPLCPSGYTWCSGLCADLITDPNHCGACGRSVGSSQVCKNGQIACQSSYYTPCGSECVDLKRDEQHCGACGKVCGAGQQCDDGQCLLEKTSTSSTTTCGAVCSPQACAKAYAVYYNVSSCQLHEMISCSQTPPPTSTFSGSSCGTSMPYRSLRCLCLP
ncbi:MAG: hypothetical protein HYZ28_05590 [Myxococcales bacterium]|nr:hypothetical protein [Myxococcales bacterium]